MDLFRFMFVTNIYREWQFSSVMTCTPKLISLEPGWIYGCWYPMKKSEKRWQFLLPCLVESKEIADGQSKQWEASEVCLRIFVIKEEQRCLSDLP